MAQAHKRMTYRLLFWNSGMCLDTRVGYLGARVLEKHFKIFLFLKLLFNVCALKTCASDGGTTTLAFSTVGAFPFSSYTLPT
jgi:hypothetical protein